jgi:hypothetical protein
MPNVHTHLLLRGDHASRPAANTLIQGALYYCTDHSKIYQGDGPGNAWTDYTAAFALLTGGTFSGDISVPDEAYGVGWNASAEVPTKNAIYDKIETLTGVTDGDKGDVTVSASGATWTIDNDVVTYAKIQNVSAASKLLGRGDSGSGDTQEITLGTGLAMTGTTLSSSGGSGGGLVFLERHAASASASLDFTAFVSATYDKYLIVGESLLAATSTADLELQIGTGGGPTWNTTSGDYGCFAVGMDSTGVAFTDTSSLWRPLKSMGNSTALVGNFQLIITGLENTARRKDVFGIVSYYNSTPRGIIANFSGTCVPTTAVTGLRFIMSSGNITSGSITIYGLTNS